MLEHTYSHPNELVKLAQLAMEKKEAHLAWRVLTVALTAEGSTDKAVRQASAEVATVLKKWWGELLVAAIHGRKL